MQKENLNERNFHPEHAYTHWLNFVGSKNASNSPPQMQQALPPPNSGALFNAYDQIAQAVNGFVANDPHELAKEAECYREVEVFRAKEAIKASNRLLSSENREKSHSKHIRFYQNEDGFVLQVTNGHGTIVWFDIVYHMKIVHAYIIKDPINPGTCYLYQVLDPRKPKNEYEYIFIDSHPLSIKALKRFFAQFYVPTLQYEKEAWQYLEATLSGYTYEIRSFPQLPGWLKENSNYKFIYARDDILISRLMPGIKTVTVPEPLLSSDDSLALIRNFCNEENLQETLIMLMYRLAVLLYPLFDKVITIPMIDIIGENALSASKRLLNPLIGLNNDLNLDLENKATIIKHLKTLHNVPVICFTHSFDNGSSFSHLREVISYSKSTDRKDLPIVVCIPKVDQKTELFDIVIESEKLPDLNDIEDSFNTIQAVIIQKIESSGEYFPTLLNQILVTKYKDIPDTLRIFYIVSDLLSSMFKNEDIHIDELMRKGLDVIKSQSENPSGFLLDYFRSAIISAVENHNLVVLPRKSAPLNTSEGRERIYYDETFYYIPTHCFVTISELGNFTSKSSLKLRQKLAEKGVLKTYKNSFSHIEYTVDFFVEYAAGSEKKSGLAISTSFFDDELGLTLFERGNHNDNHDDW